MMKLSACYSDTTLPACRRENWTRILFNVYIVGLGGVANRESFRVCCCNVVLLMLVLWSSSVWKMKSCVSIKRKRQRPVILKLRMLGTSTGTSNKYYASMHTTYQYIYHHIESRARATLGRQLRRSNTKEIKEVVFVMLKKIRTSYCGFRCTRLTVRNIQEVAFPYMQPRIFLSAVSHTCTRYDK
jgi:hypothetical protein